MPRSVNETYNQEFYSTQWRGALTSAQVCVPLIVELCGPLTSAIDVGCGTGAWLSVFRNHGVANILGLDGGAVDRSSLLIPEASFRRVDLGRPPRDLGRYDLALCLEVAEHLPKSQAASIVAFVVSLAPVVVWSAAIPFQGGTQHVNEQWPSYWENHFAEFKYVMIDALRPRLWNDKRVEVWYRQNLFIFARADNVAKHDHLRSASVLQRDALLPVVHPELWERAHRAFATHLATTLSDNQRASLLSSVITHARRHLK